MSCSKLRGDEFACGFGWIVAANPRLGVPLQFLQSSRDSGAMCLAHTVVTADQCVSETDFGAENVASHPARCSTALVVVPSALLYPLPPDA